MAVGGAEHFMPGATPEMLQAFVADRAALTAGMRRAPLHDGLAQLSTYFAWLEAQLADGRAWLMGAQPCIADFAAVQTMWFLRRAPKSAALVNAHAAVAAWADRVLAFGEGRPQEMSSQAAIDLARSTPAAQRAPVAVMPGLGLEAGQAVQVSALDYGADPVAGTLVGLSQDEVVVARSDERAGAVHVHFPRVGFQIRKEQAA